MSSSFSVKLPKDKDARASSSSTMKPTRTHEMPPWSQPPPPPTMNNNHPQEEKETLVCKNIKSSCTNSISMLLLQQQQHDVSERGLQRLEEELELFARYVMLTPGECRSCPKLRPFTRIENVSGFVFS